MPSNRLKKSLTTTIVVPAILMALAAIALLWQLDRQMNETDWVEHTDRVMLLAETAKAEFLSAQTALRGFLLSSDPNDRGPIQKHWNNSQEIIKQLGGLVSDNPSQEQRVITLNGLENQWLEAANGADQNSADAEKRELARRAAAIGTKVLARVRCDLRGRTGVAGSQRRTAGFSIQHRDVGYPHRRIDSRGGADVGGVARNPEREQYIRRRVERCRGSEPGEDQFPRRGLA